MNTSTNLGMYLPENGDYYSVDHMNGNTQILDEEVSSRLKIFTISEDTDLNDLVASGVYYMPQNKTYTNMPEGVINGWLMVFSNINSVKQVLFRRGSATTHFNIYTRLIDTTGTVIGDWVRLATENDLGSLEDLDLDPQATDFVTALNDLYTYAESKYGKRFSKSANVTTTSATLTLPYVLKQGSILMVEVIDGSGGDYYYGVFFLGYPGTLREIKSTLGTITVNYNPGAGEVIVSGLTSGTDNTVMCNVQH